MELTSRRDARFRVPLAIQTTKYRAYLRHAYVFLRSLPRQWNRLSQNFRKCQHRSTMIGRGGSETRPYSMHAIAGRSETCPYRHFS